MHDYNYYFCIVPFTIASLLKLGLELGNSIIPVRRDWWL